MVVAYDLHGTTGVTTAPPEAVEMSTRSSMYSVARSTEQPKPIGAGSVSTRTTFTRICSLRNRLNSRASLQIPTAFAAKLPRTGEGKARSENRHCHLPNAQWDQAWGRLSPTRLKHGCLQEGSLAQRIDFRVLEHLSYRVLVGVEILGKAKILGQVAGFALQRCQGSESCHWLASPRNNHFLSVLDPLQKFRKPTLCFVGVQNNHTLV